MKFPKHKFLILFITGLLLNGCVEPYDFQTEEFDDLLVVQATLTDEMKYQEVVLSKTYRLEEDAPNPLSRAQVVVSSEDLQLQHFFWEVTPGVYRSAQPFAIRSGVSYVLSIDTEEGKSYTSEPVEMISGNEINKLYAERTKVQGKDGIALQINSSNPETASKFYRYEYEETYKIVSPYRVMNNVIGDPLDWSNWWIEPNNRDEEICYNTRQSQEIILSSTSSLGENNLQSFLVHFINSDNPVLAHRYSILVKQYSLSSEAYTYFSTLKELSGEGSVFFENQPGFVYGNMSRLDDDTERVIGFFNLSSVSSKRLFFNYEDFYTWEDSPRPQFPPDCNIYRPGIDYLIPLELIMVGDSRYVSMSGPPDPLELGEGPMRLIATECVDCTVYGTTQAPEFWEE